MKVEVAVPGSRPLTVLYGLCGRKATLNMNNFITCRVSIRCHIWPWLMNLVTLHRVVFYDFSFDCFSEGLAYKTGRLVQPIVQGNSVFSDKMGQEIGPAKDTEVLK